MHILSDDGAMANRGRCPNSEACGTKFWGSPVETEHHLGSHNAFYPWLLIADLCGNIVEKVSSYDRYTQGAIVLEIFECKRIAQHRPPYMGKPLSKAVEG